MASGEKRGRTFQGAGYNYGRKRSEETREERE